MSSLFAEWLKAEMVERDWSHVHLARESGLSVTRVLRLLGGARPTRDECEALARALYVSVETVFTEAGWAWPRPDPGSDLDEWLGVLDGLDATERRVLLRIGKAIVRRGRPE